MEKEKWIQSVLETTKSIQKLPPTDGMYDAILDRVHAEKRLSPKTIWMAAASVLLLATLNIVAVTKITATESKETNNIVENDDSPLYVNNQLY